MAALQRLAVLQSHLQSVRSQVDSGSTVERKHTETTSQGKLSTAHEAVAAVPNGATITVRTGLELQARCDHSESVLVIFRSQVE